VPEVQESCGCWRKASDDWTQRDAILRCGGALAFPRLRGLSGGRSSSRPPAPAGCRQRLAAQRSSRRGAMTLTPQGLPCRARPPRRLLPVARAGFQCGLRAALGRRARVARRLQFHAGTPGLGQTDRNRLFRILRAVLAFTDVMDLFAYEFTRLRRFRFAGALVPPRAPQRFLLRHKASLLTANATSPPLWLGVRG
jgi:hypothetical protein